jgi:hypothetical protein
MKIWIVLFGIFAFGSTGIYAAARRQELTRKYTQNAGALENEFEPFFEAYSKADVTAQDKAFTVFLFPDEKAWFGQNFPPEDVEQLVWDSEAAMNLERKD